MKIGNAGGFWGDDIEAAYRLAKATSDLDYITLDYLAELSLSIMGAQQHKNPELGYAADFLEVVDTLIPLWEAGARFKVVTNAGGLNPNGLKREIEKRLPIKKVVAVSGDAVLARLKADPNNPLFRHLETEVPLSSIVERLYSANAYLGAEGIRQALSEGADIVVTGRVADPSLTVGPALFHFGWQSDEYDKIAQATVAGHLIECGTQVTGGISTAWQRIEEPWNMGYPYVDMQADGTFVITKPDGTAGKVDLMTVKEQLLYEIGDPAKYLSPDATVSFLSLQLEQIGPDQVRVSGAKGTAPPKTYKVSATYTDGYRAEGSLLFVGGNAREKAQAGAQMILKRAEVQSSQLELFGERDECYMRLAARSPDKKALEHFLKQFAPLVTRGPPGTTGYTGGRGKVRPVFGYWPCLIEREALHG